MTTVMTLTVDTGAERLELTPGMELTFGRDRTCGLCLDPDDIGISRFAGRISHQQRVWTIVNLSSKRALHIRDGAGFTLPLPVAVSGGPASRRMLDQQVLTVMVAGDRRTHALVLRLARPTAPALAPPAPADPVSTSTQAPQLTDRQREALVALAGGYLLRHPHYDPHPRTYQQVADSLGLTKRQVMKRVERVRDDLVAAHVPGLTGGSDSRRPLCEWLVAMRVITPDDLEWLESRQEAARLTRHLDKVPRAISRATRRGAEVPTTTHVLHDRVTRIAERTARQIAPALQRRLRDHHGDRWRRVVSERQARDRLPYETGLRDYRLCLSLLGHDPATHGWVDDQCRSSARELVQLANAAAHRRRLRPADVDRAGVLAAMVVVPFA